MITADQLVAHAIGDYILQSHYMATEKVRQHLAAAVHAVTYSVPFLFLTRSLVALAVICGTHFVIDRWRLARYVIWIKNLVGSPPPWRRSTEVMALSGRWRSAQRFPPLTATGYPRATPDFLAVWLFIIADNVLHVLTNGAALRWL